MLISTTTQSHTGKKPYQIVYGHISADWYSGATNINTSSHWLFIGKMLSMVKSQLEAYKTGQNWQAADKVIKAFYIRSRDNVLLSIKIVKLKQRPKKL